MPLSSHPQVPPQTTPTEAAHLAADGHAVLLDVREQEEFDAGRTPEALWLPLGALAAGAALPAGAEDRAVLVLCRSGNRPQLAALHLAAAGVPAVNVAGGMSAWAQAGLPVTTATGAAGRIV